MAYKSIPLNDKSGEQAAKAASSEENPVVTEVKEVVTDTGADLTAQHTETPSKDGAKSGAEEQPALKKVIVPKGAIVEFEDEAGKEYTDAQLLQGFNRYETYTRKMSEVDEKRKSVEEDAKKVADNIGYLTAIQRSKFGFLYTNNIVQGVPEEKAIRLALEGSGVSIGEIGAKAASSSNGRMQLPDPPDDIEPGTPEFAQWAIDKTAELASQRAESNLTPQLTEIKQMLEGIRNESKEKEQRTQEEERKRQEIFAANTNTRTVIDEMLAQRFGAEFAQWPQERKDAIYLDLHRTLLSRGKDPLNDEYLHREVISEGDYAQAVLTSFPVNYKINGQQASAKAPIRTEIIKTEEKNLSAGPQGRVSLPLYGAGDGKREKTSRDLLEESAARMAKAAKPVA